jgi:maltose phosphorylase
MRVKEGVLHFNPYMPDQWQSYSFRIEFRDRVLKVRVAQGKTDTVLESGAPLDIFVNGEKVTLK